MSGNLMAFKEISENWPKSREKILSGNNVIANVMFVATATAVFRSTTHVITYYLANCSLGSSAVMSRGNVCNFTSSGE